MKMTLNFHNILGTEPIHKSPKKNAEKDQTALFVYGLM